MVMSIVIGLNSSGLIDLSYGRLNFIVNRELYKHDWAKIFHSTSTVHDNEHQL